MGKNGKKWDIYGKKWEKMGVNLKIRKSL